MTDTNTDTDLALFAAELNEQAKSLADGAQKAAHEAQIIAAEPAPEIALDRDFSEKLETALAGPRRRMREIAKGAR